MVSSTPGTVKTVRKVTFEEEVDYWCDEFPDLSREDIAETLREFDSSVDKSIDDSYNYDTYSK